MPEQDVAEQGCTAQRFVERLEQHRSAEELAKIQRYFRSGEGEYGAGDVFLGVRMGQVFALSAEFVDMPLAEIETLLESPVHEARAGAVKIMAKQASARTATEERRRELYELYLRRIDRIDNWDLVDLGAWDVVGRHLADKPRHVLDELARSTDVWERRTAILSTLFFVRRGELDDTFRVAAALCGDDHDLVHKAVGGVLREAGKKDRARLLAFLDEHAAAIPPTALRYATAHFDADERAHYRGLRRTGRA
ncbi:DNA alkylation repair protein [Pseudonocardia nigra]|uniref:DNA alkylation repair protein n=1 Tax=Pseudonocardia nigra TaxID=1921578 RepID=UPI0027E37B95|nr:DNA alkylation repair protein [Pseudonocardia nigra]